MTNNRLAELEQQIENKLAEAGELLAIIQTEKLYKPAHKSFSSYVKARWGNSYEWARLAIKDAKLLRQLSPLFGTVNAYHARALGKIEPELRVPVAQLLNTHPDDKLTIASIGEVADTLKEVLATHHFDLGEDGQIPSQIKKAAEVQIAEKAYERHLRHQEHIKASREAKPIEEQISYAATRLCELLELPQDTTVTVTIEPGDNGLKTARAIPFLQRHGGVCSWIEYAEDSWPPWPTNLFTSDEQEPQKPQKFLRIGDEPTPPMALRPSE